MLAGCGSSEDAAAAAAPPPASPGAEGGAKDVPARVDGGAPDAAPPRPADDDELDDTGLPSGIPDKRYATQGVFSGTSGREPFVAFSDKGRVAVLDSKTGNRVVFTVIRPNGQPDTRFGIGGKTDVALPDTLAAPDAITGDILVDDEGRVIVYGHKQLASASAKVGFIARFAGGALDPTFANAGILSAPHTSFIGLRAFLDASGSVASYYTDAVDLSLPYAVRLGRVSAAGFIDTAFAGASVAAIADQLLAIDAAGRLLLRESTPTSSALLRFLPSGAIDAAWGTSGRVELPTGGGPFTQALPLADGSLVVTQYPPQQGSRLLRYDDQGRQGDVFPGESTREATSARLPLRVVANRLLLSDDTVVIERWTPGGTLDGTYGTGGRAELLPLCTIGETRVKPAVTRSGGAVVLSEKSTGGETVVWRLQRLTR